MSGTEGTGEPMTMAALHDLIDAQQAQLAALRAELGLLEQVEPAPARRDVAPAGSIGRRALFGKAAAVLVAGAGMAAVGGAQPAFAGSDGDVVLGSSNDAGADPTQIVSTNSFFAISGFNTAG
ncbi:MAG: hypothetical protein WCB04_14940, partial [Mycobacteriales bacterium]